MARSVARIAMVMLASALLMPTVVLAETPAPVVSLTAPPDFDPGTLLVTASVDLARLLVNVGLILVVLAFAVMLLTVIVTTPALMAEIRKIVSGWRQRGQAEDDAGSPAFPFSELFRSMFAAIPELIRTPVGVGMALVLLGVVLLLGQGAITGRFTEAGASIATPSPSDPPSAGATQVPDASDAPSSPPSQPAPTCPPAQATRPTVCPT